MLAGLGFLAAALLTVFLSPLYRRRVSRLTTEALKRSMPLTEAEIRADKDRLRAEFAIRIHKLETKLDEDTEMAARQMVDLNRRDAAISALEDEVSHQRTALEEHENARRVLEQTIMDRLPKVEHRLAEARKLLFQRDREIVDLEPVEREAIARARRGDADQHAADRRDPPPQGGAQHAGGAQSRRSRRSPLRRRGGAAHRDRGAALQVAQSGGAHRPHAGAAGARRPRRRGRGQPRAGGGRRRAGIEPSRQGARAPPRIGTEGGRRRHCRRPVRAVGERSQRRADGG